MWLHLYQVVYLKHQTAHVGHTNYANKQVSKQSNA